MSYGIRDDYRNNPDYDYGVGYYNRHGACPFSDEDYIPDEDEDEEQEENGDDE